MRLHRLLISATATTCLVLVATPALAATDVLDLELDEPAGSTVAVDSSGLGHDGAIGSHIKMNGAWADWDRHSPSSTTYYGADHLIMIDDDPSGSLDPGSENFAIEFRYRSTDKFGNILQKGQATTVGGQVKFQQPKGYLSCMFRSPTGKGAVKTTMPLNDGQWHVIRCERTPGLIALYVDGQLNRRIWRTTGTIDNTKPWTLGGKFDCDTSDPTVGADSCDYFPGDIDYVRMTKG